jgi:hypothetical protein
MEQFRVQGAGLSCRAVQPPVGRDVGFDDNEAFLQCDRFEQVQEKGLAAAEPADDEPAGRPAGSNDFQILDERLNLIVSADLEMLQPHRGHNPG